jgi:hypothetical protein
MRDSRGRKDRIGPELLMVRVTEVVRNLLDIASAITKLHCLVPVVGMISLL